MRYTNRHFTYLLYLLTYYQHFPFSVKRCKRCCA